MGIRRRDTGSIGYVHMKAHAYPHKRGILARRSRTIGAVLAALVLVTTVGCGKREPYTGAPKGTPSSPSSGTTVPDINTSSASVNGKALRDSKGGADTSFVVVGHAYGSNREELDTTPSRPLLNSLPTIKQLQPDFLMSLGDMIRISNPEQFDILDQRLLNAVDFPIFNAPGNHDVADRALYEERYGKQTWYSFHHAGNLMLVLDTERGQCSINREQFAFVSRALQAAAHDPKVRNVFVFMHKTWLVQDPRVWTSENPAAQPNKQKCPRTTPVFHKLYTQVEKTARAKPTYVFAGDVGAWGNMTPFVETRRDIPLNIFATGLGDTERDSGILVTIRNGAVSMKVLPFSGQAVEPLRQYTFDYWLQQPSLKEAPLAPQLPR